MKSIRKLAVIVVALGSVSVAQGDTIEFDIDYSLSIAPIFGDFGDGQTLGGVGQFFTDDPIVFGLGDTLIVNIMFDQRLQVFDFRGSTDEYFSFGMDCGRLCTGGGFSGDWTSSIEALGARGDIWSDPIFLSFQGGGGGFGWGGQGIQITGSQGNFNGIRWVTTFTAVREGDPFTLGAFTGVQMGADGIRILPVSVPEPGTLALFGLGLAAMGLTRRKRKLA